MHIHKKTCISRAIEHYIHAVYSLELFHPCKDLSLKTWKLFLSRNGSVDGTVPNWLISNKGYVTSKIYSNLANNKGTIIMNLYIEQMEQSIHHDYAFTVVFVKFAYCRNHVAIDRILTFFFTLFWSPFVFLMGLIRLFEEF